MPRRRIGLQIRLARFDFGGACHFNNMETIVEEIGELRRFKYIDDKDEYVDTPQINIFYSFIEEKGKDSQYIARICASIYNLIAGNISDKNEKEEFERNFDNFFHQYKNPEHHIIINEEKEKIKYEI